MYLVASQNEWFVISNQPSRQVSSGRSELARNEETDRRNRVSSYDWSDLWDSDSDLMTTQVLPYEIEKAIRDEKMTIEEWIEEIKVVNVMRFYLIFQIIMIEKKRKWKWTPWSYAVSFVMTTFLVLYTGKTKGSIISKMNRMWLVPSCVEDCVEFLKSLKK